MDSASSQQHTQYRDLLLLALFGALMFFPFLGRRDIWTSGEARVAQVARQMRVSGEWIIPYMGDDVRLKKPPLAYWLTALATIPFDTVDENGDTQVHVTEFNSRIPNALCAIGLLLTIYLFGVSLCGRACGIYSALSLATTGVIWWQARMTGIEMPQLFFNVLALFAWWRYHDSENKKAGWLVLCYAALSLSALAKGIGPMIVLLIIWSYLLLSAQPLRRPNIKHHLIAFAVFCAIGLPWPIKVLSTMPDTIKTWGKESGGRLEGFDHFKQPFYFFTKIFGDGQPWILLSIPAIFFLPQIVRKRILQTLFWGILLLANLLLNYWLRMGSLFEPEHYSEIVGPAVTFAVLILTCVITFFACRPLQRYIDRLSDSLQSGSTTGNTLQKNIALPWAWTISVLLFFSLFSSKKSYYILPIYPALALLMGYVMHYLQHQTAPDKGKRVYFHFCRILGYILIGCGVLLYPAIYFATTYAERFAKYSGHNLQAAIIAVLGFAVGLTLIRTAKRQHVRKSFTSLLCGTVIAMGVYVTMLDEINDYKGVKALCASVKPLLQDDDDIITYWISGLPTIQYYLDRDVDRIWDEWQLYKRLSSKQRVILLIQPEDESDLRNMYVLPEITGKLKNTLQENDFRPAGSEGKIHLFRYTKDRANNPDQILAGLLEGTGLKPTVLEELVYPIPVPHGHEGEIWMCNQEVELPAGSPAN